jgi:hypothetical protein
LPSGLTVKQEKFRDLVVSGVAPVEAYRQAYSASKMSRGAIGAAAHGLMHHPKVSKQIGDLREKAAEKAQLTLEQHLRNLEEIAKEAREAGQLSAAAAAEKSRGQAAGLYTKRVQKEERITIVIEGKDAKA